MIIRNISKELERRLRIKFNLPEKTYIHPTLGRRGMKPLPSEIPEPDINNVNVKIIDLYNNYYI